MDSTTQCAWSYLVDPTKHADADAMKSLLMELGLSDHRELTMLTDTHLQMLLRALKPVGRRAVGNIVLGTCKTVHLVAESAWGYLCDANKHINPSVMASLLQELGLSTPFELAFVNSQQWQQIMDQLKPVAKAVFSRWVQYFLSDP